MRNIIVIAVVTLLATNASSVAASDGELSIEAVTPLLEIDPMPPGPRIIRLPDIAFTLRVTALCGDDMQTRSVSISISDTRRTLTAELFAESPTTEQSISVPRRQLAPLTVDNFCVSDDSGGDERLHIADALSAQLALHCAGEQRESVIYEAVPLAVEFRCRLPGDD